LKLSESTIVPDRFDAIAPSTNLRIFNEPRRNEMLFGTGLGILATTGLAQYRTDSATARHQRLP
jgi:hypothetical protein